MKQESQQQKEQKVPEEFPQTEHISNPTQQERLGKFARLFGGRRKDLLDIALKQGLTPEQLEEVRKCLESGLTDLDIIRIIETGSGKNAENEGNPVACQNPERGRTWLRWIMRSF